jgi:hypothetical protein
MVRVRRVEMAPGCVDAPAPADTAAAPTQDATADQAKA